MFGFFKKEEKKEETARIIVDKDFCYIKGIFRPAGPQEAKKLLKELQDKWQECDTYEVDISNLKYMNSCMISELCHICIEKQEFTNVPVITVLKKHSIQEAFFRAMYSLNNKFQKREMEHAKKE